MNDGVSLVSSQPYDRPGRRCMNGGPRQGVEWRVVDPEGLETIARVRLPGIVISYWLLLIQGVRDIDPIRAAARPCASHQATTG